MECVSTGIARLIKSLPRRVFGNDPERLRDFYGLASAGLARLLVQEPTASTPPSAGAISSTRPRASMPGVQHGERPRGAGRPRSGPRPTLRVPVFARFLREEGLRVACRDTVALLLAHAVAEARELGAAGGEINVALVTPERRRRPRRTTWRAGWPAATPRPSAVRRRARPEP